MKRRNLIQKHGFRPGTRNDFMAFAGAESDSLFRHRDFGSRDAGCVGIYSESTGAYHFYVFVDGDDSVGKLIEGDRLTAITCAAAFDEWADFVEARTADSDWAADLLAAGFEKL